MILRLQNVVRLITDHLSFVYSYFNSLLASDLHGFCIRHYSVTDTKATHTVMCQKHTRQLHFSTFSPTSLQKLSVNNASFPTPPIFVYLTLLPLVCVERGGGKRVRELEDVMWDALTECSAVIAK